MKQSVELSSNFRFVNNRLDLAHVLSGEEAKKYKQEALENVECVFTEEELSHINDEDWLKKRLNSQSYINEFILGTHMTSIVYKAKFGKLISVDLSTQKLRVQFKSFTSRIHER